MVAIKPSRVTVGVGGEETEPPEISFLWKTYIFFAFTAPPVGENENAFGSAYSEHPSTCDSNLGSIGRSVRDLCHFPWNRPRPLTSEVDCGRALRDPRIPSLLFCLDWSRDTVCKFSWDLDEVCRNRSEKCVLKKIQNGGKSILTQMGVAYMERCVMTQGIQGKKNFDFTTYGSRVMGQKVKRAVIAPPSGRKMWLCFK